MQHRKRIYFVNKPVPIEGEQVTIIKVHDGDTVMLSDGRKIRFQGMDAPELRQDWGINARDKLIELLKQYNFKAKLVDHGEDKYGRRIGNLYLGDYDLDVSLTMITSGNAWAYRMYLGGKPEEHPYIDAEEKAAANGVGLWSMPNPINPSDFRHSKHKKNIPSGDQIESQGNSLECTIL